MESVMERRNLLAGLVILVVGLFALTGTASAHRTSTQGSKPAVAEPPVCVVHSLPSFTDQGEFGFHSSVADVIEVECEAVFAEQYVQISDHELASRCEITWAKGHSKPEIVKGATVKKVKLDDAGNAEVAFIAGPSCAAGETLVSAHLEEAPYSTVTTAYTVVAPHDTTTGVSVVGAENKPFQVEDDFDSSLYAIVQVEFPSVYAEQEVEVAAEQLFDRCQVAPHLVWAIPAEAGKAFTIGLHFGETVKLKLDNNGSAFAVIDAEESCASGTSLIEASLVKAPYTTKEAEFEVQSPHETF
jgi:hypothetical protein